MKGAAELSHLLDVEVEDHPYDLGYWSRLAGDPRPVNDITAKLGWDEADRELAAEAEEEP